MKYTTLPILALAARQTQAQFFVLYGRDTLTSRIDPILSPGNIGAHAHEFMGAGNVTQNSNYVSLQKSSCTSVGRANGNPIVEDKSIYWHPTLYVKLLKDGSYVRVPTNGHQIYYINAGSGQMREPFEFPPGFRMTAGSSYYRSPQPNPQTQWICHESPSWNQGPKGGFPSDVTSCPQYPFFNAAIEFPHCWNGKDFNINDPYSHVSYPMGDPRNGACPTSHPIRLPHLFMENNYDLSSLEGQFAVNSLVLSNGDPTGFGFHADFFNGWREDVLHNLLDGPASCDSHDVGDCQGVTFDASKSVFQCTATNPYPEDLDGPLDGLPGCNPITTTNPAPRCPACSQGVVGGQCAAAAYTTFATSTRTTTRTRTMVVTPTSTDSWESDC